MIAERGRGCDRMPTAFGGSARQAVSGVPALGAASAGWPEFHPRQRERSVRRRPTAACRTARRKPSAVAGWRRRLDDRATDAPRCWGRHFSIPRTRRSARHFQPRRCLTATCSQGPECFDLHGGIAASEFAPRPNSVAFRTVGRWTGRCSRRVLAILFPGETATAASLQSVRPACYNLGKPAIAGGAGVPGVRR